MPLVIAVYDPEDTAFIKKEAKIVKTVPAKIAPYKMYNIGDLYPAVVRSNDWDKDFIFCDLIAIDEPKPLLNKLHKLKWCCREDQSKSLWSFDPIGGTPMKLFKNTKRESRVYIYQWLRGIKNHKFIKSGKWRASKR